MLANKDSVIKLFGKTIQLGSISYGGEGVASRIEASADYDDGCDCISSDGNLLCSKRGRNLGNEVCVCVCVRFLMLPLIYYQRFAIPRTAHMLNFSALKWVGLYRLLFDRFHMLFHFHLFSATDAFLWDIY